MVLNLDFNSFKELASEFVDNYVIDEENKEIIEALIEYFNEDKAFEKRHESFSLRKGIFLMGSVGSGKTLLMRIFQRYLFYKYNKTFSISNIQDISTNFVETGSIKQYENRELVIDEIGILSKEHLQRWGNSTNIFENLITSRYNKFCTLNLISHITTNLTREQLKEEYDPRIYSRLKEMCNVLVLISKDRRETSKPKEIFKPKTEKNEKTELEEAIDTCSQILLHAQECKREKRYTPAGVFDFLAWLYFEFLEKYKIVYASAKVKQTYLEQAHKVAEQEQLNLKDSQEQDKAARAITIAKSMLYEEFITREDAEDVLTKFLSHLKSQQNANRLLV